MTGVEGYVESAASGIVAALNALYNQEDKTNNLPYRNYDWSNGKLHSR